jgi:hypothetical protein
LGNGIIHIAKDNRFVKNSAHVNTSTKPRLNRSRLSRT